ncbi:MAG: hypothetical protein Q9191_000497 [Dirinaria sp. TL-2023a]
MRCLELNDLAMERVQKMLWARSLLLVAFAAEPRLVLVDHLPQKESRSPGTLKDDDIVVLQKFLFELLEQRQPSADSKL